MQLWTYHPSDFRVDDPDLVVDYTKGKYAEPSSQVNGFRYREVATKLHKRVGTTQILWCFVERGRYVRVTEDVDKDVMEWELNVPLTQILAFYRVSVWEDIIWSRNDEWEHLVIAVEIEPPASRLSDLGALVRVPLSREWTTCHGHLPPKYPKTRVRQRATAT